MIEFGFSSEWNVVNAEFPLSVRPLGLLYDVVSAQKVAIVLSLKSITIDGPDTLAVEVVAGTPLSTDPLGLVWVVVPFKVEAVVLVSLFITLKAPDDEVVATFPEVGVFPEALGVEEVLDESLLAVNISIPSMKRSYWGSAET